ncbi:transcriptional regulator [Pseudoalteromonas sp. S3260]|uniref:Mor transcription activator family protein n=1 Tax=Pseudoalteromonas sp. S3260 TaxID=579534 RepID=UPI00110A72C6|nr:Mor transcription activator family protein [Pseudoalteromonas sp. S3260]TMO98700.1 transcriptional regulator [Pseudoalteromonas sp. S3260]
MPNQEQQSELFGESVEQLQDCLSNLSTEDAAEVRKRWPSNLQSLALLIEAELNKAKVNEAQSVGESITLAIGHYFGGRDVYIPTDQRLKAALRDIQIWQEYRGNNVEALAIKFGLTERRIAEIIQHQRAVETQRRQRSLF